MLLLTWSALSLPSPRFSLRSCLARARYSNLKHNGSKSELSSWTHLVTYNSLIPSPTAALVHFAVPLSLALKGLLLGQPGRKPGRISSATVPTKLSSTRWIPGTTAVRRRRIPTGPSARRELQVPLRTTSNTSRPLGSTLHHPLNPQLTLRTIQALTSLPLSSPFRTVLSTAATSAILRRPAAIPTAVPTALPSSNAAAASIRCPSD